MTSDDANKGDTVVADRLKLTSKSSDNPSWRIVTEPAIGQARQSCHHYIAYRSATLVSHSAGSTLKEYKGEDGTLVTSLVPLPEGKDMPPVVRIHAEDLYIYSGDTFDFPGKTVILMVKRLFVVPGNSSEPVTFLVKGADYPASPYNDKDEGPQGGTGDNGRDGDADHNITKARDGYQGGQGQTGLPGGEAGRFFFCGQVISLCGADVVIKIAAIGGKGGQGQRGGRGGTGGKGPYTGWHQAEDSINGGNGGQGGRGGTGGAGGHGGTVVIRQLPVTAYPVGTHSVTFDAVVTGGEGGEGGPGGYGGFGGESGTYQTGGPGYYPIDVPCNKGASGGEGDTGYKPSESGPIGHKTVRKIDPLTLDPTTPPSIAALISSKLPLGPFASLLDPFFMQMVLQRLLFEYELLYGSQYDLSDVNTAPAVGSPRYNFDDTSRWLTGMSESLSVLDNKYEDAVWPEGGWSVSENKYVQLTDQTFKTDTSQSADLRSDETKDFWNSTTQKNGRATFLTAFKDLAGFSFHDNALQARDLYQQTFRYIPRINFNMETFEHATAALQQIEDARGAYADAIAQGDAQKDAIRASIQEMDIIDSHKYEDRAKAKEAINDAIKWTEKWRQDLEKKKADVKSSISLVFALAVGRFVCTEVEKVIGAAATCMMFTAGSAARTVKTGNLLSVGNAGASAVNSNDLQIILEIDDIDSSLDGDKLQKEIGDRANVELAAKTVRLLTVEESKFRALCDSYFNGAVTRGARQAFEDLLSTAKGYHQSLIAYQRTILSQAQVESRLAQAADAKGRAERQVDLSEPSISVLYQYYDIVYAMQKARVMKLYHDSIRVITALKLERLNVVDQLIHLGSWQNVSGQEFNTQIITKLADNIDDLRSGFAYHSASIFKPSKTLTAVSHPWLFGGVLQPDGTFSKRTGVVKPFSIDITPETALEYLDIDLTMYSHVRLVECWIVLKGAVRNLQEGESIDVNETDETKWPEIVISTVFSRKFTVTSGYREVTVDGVKGKEPAGHDFEMDTSDLLSSYRYDPKNPQITHSASKLVDPRTRMVYLGDGTYCPLQTPLTVWNVYWNEDLINTSNVTGIQFNLEIHANSAQAVHNNMLYAALGNDDDELAPDFQDSPVLSPNASILKLPTSDFPRVEVIEEQVDAPLNLSLTQLPSGQDTLFDPVSGITVFPVLPGTWRPWVARTVRSIAIRATTNLGLRNGNERGFEAVHSFMRALTPTGYTTRRTLGSTAIRGLNAISPDIDVRTQYLLNNPRHLRALSASRDAVDSVVSSVDSVQTSDRYNTLHTVAQVDEGHSGIVGGAVELQNAGDLFQDAAGGVRHRALVYLFSSFGQGSLFITGQHRDSLNKLTEAKDRLEYCLIHEDEISKDAITFFQGGGNLKDVDVRLGKNSIIRFADISVRYEGIRKDIIVLSATAATTSVHVLVGLNQWMMRYDPRRPHEIIFVNVLQGEHNNLFFDVGNLAAGEHLMALSWRLMVLKVKAERTGVDLDTIIKNEAPYLAQAQSWFRYIDAPLRPYVVRKSRLGSRVEFDRRETIDHEIKSLSLIQKPEVMLANLTGQGMPTSERPPSVTLNDFVLYPGDYATPGSNSTLAGNSPVSTISTHQLSEMRRRVEQELGDFMFNDPTRTQFKQDTDKVIDGYIKSLADVKRTPQALYDEITREPNYLIDVRDVVRKSFVTGIATQVTGEVRNLAAFKSMSPSSLYRLVMDTMECHVHTPLIDRGGLVESYARLKLIGKVATVSPAEVGQLLAQSTQEVSTKSAQYLATQAATAAARKLDPNDPNTETAIEKAERLENEAREKYEEAKATETENTDLDTIVKDPQGAHDTADKDKDAVEQQLEGLRNV
ncbi:hypothetical protein IAR55_005585 [Kwoniella newhampshirensis]|uniref:Uncharacterized protein n=1 Tax=Kwoniella newhampshirensis TaxID=1651941 RepID=A0AAW0YW50_9TREE